MTIIRTLFIFLVCVLAVWFVVRIFRGNYNG